VIGQFLCTISTCNMASAKCCLSTLDLNFSLAQDRSYHLKCLATFQYWQGASHAFNLLSTRVSMCNILETLFRRRMSKTTVTKVFYVLTHVMCTQTCSQGDSICDTHYLPVEAFVCPESSHVTCHKSVWV
jgi:hypothetical protein